MAVTFPTSPTNGQTFTANGLSYVYNATYGVWRLNVSTGSSGGTGGGVTTYATVAELPLTGNSNGDMAFVEETDRLYLSNDNGWFNIALINTSPTITQGGAGSYVLATDGTPTVITLTATDPEEVPLTWSYTVTSGALGTTATVSQADNVFTITPGTTDPDDVGTFEITFSVTDGTNIVNDVNSFSLVFSTIVENSKYTTALITTDGTVGTNSTFTDSSTNALTLTPTSTPTLQSFSPYRSGGYSTYFDGSDDYLSIVDDSMYATGEFTVEGWIYLKSSSITHVAFHWSDISDGNDNDLIFEPNGIVTCRVGSGGNTKTQSSSGIWSANIWHHFAVVRNSSNNVDVYLDGTHIINHGSRTDDMDNTLEIGRNPYSGGGSYLYGYISDFRIVKGTALYTSSFTPPTERLTAVANTSLLTCHLPYIADGSTNNRAISVLGNPTVEPFGPYDVEAYDITKHGGSIYFTTSGSTATSSGTGQYVQSALSSGLTLDTNDFTISCWVFGISKLRNYPRILQIGPQNSTWGASQLAILYKHNDDNDSICLAMQGIGVNAMLISSGPISDNQWYHVAVTRSGSTFTMYINGKSVGTYTSTGSATGTGDKVIILGSSTSGDSDFNGYISDVRVINGTDVYAGNFTPPTEPVSSAGSVVHVIGNNADILDKSQSNTLTLVSNTTASTTQTKYTGSSIYFDGSGDYIKLGGDFSEFFDNAWTIEFWVNLNSLSTSNAISIGDGGGVDGMYLLHGGNGFYLGSNGSWNISAYTSSTITAGQWHHCAVTWDGSDYRIFVDGALENTATSSAKLGPGPYTIAIGASYTGTQPTDGYIEDLRLTKGLARYTANFTPPTASLDG